MASEKLRSSKSVARPLESFTHQAEHLISALYVQAHFLIAGRMKIIPRVNYCRRGFAVLGRRTLGDHIYFSDMFEEKMHRLPHQPVGKPRGDDHF